MDLYIEMRIKIIKENNFNKKNTPTILFVIFFISSMLARWEYAFSPPLSFTSAAERGYFTIGREMIYIITASLFLITSTRKKHNLEVFSLFLLAFLSSTYHFYTHAGLHNYFYGIRIIVCCLSFLYFYTEDFNYAHISTLLKSSLVLLSLISIFQN